ncbi:PsbP domain-containing protein 4, chloroplastic isoform X2 [Tanacetum coccineum]
MLRQAGGLIADQMRNQEDMELVGTPVSIADLGGTEIDLRFSNPSEGRISVVVAPVLRFADYLEDDARIEKIGSPEKVINAFGPEVIGQNVEGKVMNSAVKEYSGRKYYQFELEPPHCLITATAAGNRLCLVSAYLQMVYSGRGTTRN